MKPQEAGAFLTIRLNAIAENYRALVERLGETACGAVLKADAYGLGAAQIGKTLYDAGCRDFFVAYGFEGAKLRETVPEGDIYVLHGVFADTENDFYDASLIPVLNTPEQLKRWADFAKAKGEKLPCALHVDTGMTRLAFTEEQVFALTSDAFENLNVVTVLSHLVSGEKGDALNDVQLKRFNALCARLKTVLSAPFKESLAASSGIFLGKPFHKELVRAGIVLYGFMENLTPAVELKARILEIQTVSPQQTIGYGATARLPDGGKVATVSLGYGDGYPRLLGNAGHAFVNGKKVPVIGHVSMDLTVLDVSDLTERELQQARFAEFIGKYGSLAELAKIAKTIDYEFLTNLGNRLYRIYES